MANQTALNLVASRFLETGASATEMAGVTLMRWGLDNGISFKVGTGIEL